MYIYAKPLPLTLSLNSAFPFSRHNFLNIGSLLMRKGGLVATSECIDPRERIKSRFGHYSRGGVNSDLRFHYVTRIYAIFVLSCVIVRV